MIKPSIPKGTRDFSPVEMMRRNYIFQTIRSVFERHAYLPIETPSMENLSTLMGKYGEEGDRLLFKILNSGDFTQGVDMTEPSATRLATKICEKGLRYDLTVPFARYVVQHQSEITFPFTRPSPERPLPRVLPVRRRCGRHQLPPQRGGTDADHFRNI